MALFRQPSFHGGEIAPNLYGRTDIEAYGAAVRTMRNFIPTPVGTAVNRPGFVRVAPSVTAYASRLVPFTFSTSQSYVLEFGNQKVRVLQGGAYVLDGLSNPVEIQTPYPHAYLADLTFTQSGDVLTIMCPGLGPKELRRYSATVWGEAGTGGYAGYQVLKDWATTRTQVAPASVSFPDALTQTDTSTTAAKSWRWVATAVASGDAGEESLPSPVLQPGGTGNVVVAPNKIVRVSCASTSGAGSYNWYRGMNGVYGYVGTSKTVTFCDEGQVPNYSDQPPSERDPFASSQYPRVATYHEQRLVFANQPLYPQRVLASKTGAFKNFDYSLPQKSDDAIDFTVASRQYEEVRALISLKHLLIFTANTEFACDGGSDYALSPTNINLKPASQNGSSWLPPLVVNNVVLFVPSNHSAVREFAYDVKSQGWGGGDVSLPATHLLVDAGLSITSWCYQRSPWSVIWAVRSDGKLLSFTFSKEMDVRAWAQHDTDGTFASVCCVPEGDEDAVYACVLRDGGYSIERMASRIVQDNWRAIFLDGCVESDTSQAYSYDNLMTLGSFTTTAAGGTGTCWLSTNTLGAGDIGKTIIVHWDTSPQPTSTKMLVTGVSTPGGHSNGLAAVTLLTDLPSNYPYDSVWRGISMTSWGFQAATVTGLASLEGKSVYALSDGVTQGPFVVASGSITLTTPGLYTVVGLPYNSDIELLDFDAKDATSKSSFKNVVKVLWEVDDAASLSAGETFDELVPWVAPIGWEASPTGVANDTFVVPVSSSWNRGGRTVLRQAYPQPVTVIGVTRDVELGGV